MSDYSGRVPEPAEIADRLAIQDVLARHSRGVDRADEEALKAAYWPDAEVAYGGFNGKAHEFCAMLPRAIRAFTHTHHAISNVMIELDGADARVETVITGLAPVRRHAGVVRRETGSRDLRQAPGQRHAGRRDHGACGADGSA